MKTTLIAALIFAAFPAMGQTWSEATTAERMVLCESINTLSTTIMEGRQKGVAMSSMLSLVDETSGIDSMVINIIIEAYKRNRYQSPSVQQQVIEDFRDERYLICVQAAREQ